MLPYINLFGLALPLPALILLTGLWAGISIAERYANRSNLAPSHLYNLSLYALVAGVIGARLTYVAQFPFAFLENPGSLISPNPGLFDPLGGLAVGLITALIYLQRQNLSFWPMMDALTPAFAVYQIALSLSNFASGSAYGSPTSLPWGIELWGAVRHPTQIYEALGAGIVLWLLWPGRMKDNRKPGTLFLRFVTYSAAARLFFEAFRGDSLVTIYNLRVMQIAAWAVLVFSLWGWYFLMQEDSKIDKNPVK
jgi:phosphatidylglycerol:prolipoprotein diacylglycerol transferase